MSQQLPLTCDNSTHNQLLVGMKGYTENWRLVSWEQFLLFWLNVHIFHSEIAAKIIVAYGRSYCY